MTTFAISNFIKSKIIVSTTSGAIFNLLIAGNAFAFTFTKIADANDFFNFTGLPPAINDQGTITFLASESPGENVGIFISIDDEINLISDIDSGPNLVFNTLAINNKNTVLFLDRDTNTSTIFTVNNGQKNIIAITDSNFKRFGDDIDINDQDVVVFPALLDTGELGIYVNQDGINTPIFGPFESVSTFPASGASINNNNLVAFSLESSLIPSGIFTVDIDNGVTTRVIEAPNDFGIQISPTINNNGTFIFSGRPTGEPYNEALFINSNDKNSLIVESNINVINPGQPIPGSDSPFVFFGAPAINDKGNIAFLSILSLLDGISTEGIFIGPDLINDKVIASGDLLLGSKVQNISFSRHGLNNLGQIAFSAQLEDGSGGIFLATPDVESVPEPTTTLGLFAFSAVGAASALRRKHQ